jgi:hypothetical protein
MLLIDLDDNFVRRSLAIGHHQAQRFNAFAELGLLTTFHKIGFQNRCFRPEFVSLAIGALNPPDKAFGIVIQADINNDQECYPQNSVDIPDGPRCIFAKQAVEANQAVQSIRQPKPTPLLLLLDNPFRLPKCVLDHADESCGLVSRFSVYKVTKTSSNQPTRTRKEPVVFAKNNRLPNQ